MEHATEPPVLHRLVSRFLPSMLCYSRPFKRALSPLFWTQRAMKKGGRNQKIGDYRLRNVLEAFQAESLALTKIYMTVSKEIGKLQMEEQLLEQMLQRAEQRQQQEQAEEALALEAALEAAFEAGAEGCEAEGGEGGEAAAAESGGADGEGDGVLAAGAEGGGTAAGADCTSTAPGLQNKHSQDGGSQQSQ